MRLLKLQSMKKSSYNVGFTSQENELSATQLPVKGAIPEWLGGSLIRTAPSKFEVGKSNYRHWFDGLAMLHKFSFSRGQVNYTCKFLQSHAFQEATKKNRIVYGEFGTDPCQDLFQRVFSLFRGPDPTDNGCVNINQYGNKLTANTETPKPVSFNLENLETLGTFQYEDNLGGQLTIVHPHYDKDGTVFSYVTNLGYKSKYHVYSLAPGSASRKLIAAVPVKEPAYMHSIGMTENYIILTEFPLVVNPLQLRFSNKPFIECYQWKPELGTKIHLVNKKTGAIQHFLSEPWFSFHHVNAFEQDGEIIFDIPVFKDTTIIDQLYLDHLRTEPVTEIAGQLYRFRIKPGEKKVERHLLSDTRLELPRINYGRVNAQPYRYIFGAGNTIPGNFLDNLTKLDVTDGSAIVWHSANCYPGEPVFIERPQPIAEDDGLLLSIVLDAVSQTSFLLLLDARSMQEVARAMAPQHITFGFHGQYVAGEGQVLPTMHR
jgi:beta,beta-carotene 9',10'-dioxygenase